MDGRMKVNTSRTFPCRDGSLTEILYNGSGMPGTYVRTRSSHQAQLVVVLP